MSLSLFERKREPHLRVRGETGADRAAGSAGQRAADDQRKDCGDDQRRERQADRAGHARETSGSTNASASSAFSNGRKPVRNPSPEEPCERDGDAASDRSRAGTDSRAVRRRRSRRASAGARKARRSSRQSAARAQSAVAICAPQASASDPCSRRTAANTLCIFSSPTRLFSSAERANRPSAKKPCHVGAPNAASEAAAERRRGRRRDDQRRPATGENERKRDGQSQVRLERHRAEQNAGERGPAGPSREDRRRSARRSGNRSARGRR